MKKNIAILMGGYSSEYQISIDSGNVVYNTLNRDIYQPFKIVILKDMGSNPINHLNILILFYVFNIKNKFEK